MKTNSFTSFIIMLILFELAVKMLLLNLLRLKFKRSDKDFKKIYEFEKNDHGILKKSDEKYLKI